jgi:hypothetical protein
MGHNLTREGTSKPVICLARALHFFRPFLPCPKREVGPEQKQCPRHPDKNNMSLVILLSQGKDESRVLTKPRRCGTGWCTKYKPVDLLHIVQGTGEMPGKRPRRRCRKPRPTRPSRPALARSPGPLGDRHGAALGTEEFTECGCRVAGPSGAWPRSCVRRTVTLTLTFNAGQPPQMLLTQARAAPRLAARSDCTAIGSRCGQASCGSLGPLATARFV